MLDLKAAANSGDPHRIAAAIVECETSLAGVVSKLDDLAKNVQSEEAILSGSTDRYLAARDGLEAARHIHEQQLAILRKRHAEAVTASEAAAAKKQLGAIKLNLARVHGLAAKIDDHFASTARLLGELAAIEADVASFNTGVQAGTTAPVGPLPEFPSLQVYTPLGMMDLLRNDHLRLPRLIRDPASSLEHWPIQNVQPSPRRKSLEEINRDRLIEHRQQRTAALVAQGWTLRSYGSLAKDLSEKLEHQKVKAGMHPDLAEIEARKEADAEVYREIDQGFVPLTEIPQEDAA